MRPLPKGITMSSNETTQNPTQPSKFVQMLNNAKPSTMDDDQKATVTRRLRYAGMFAAGVLTTVATVAAVSMFANKDKTEEIAEQETEETVED